ncbi:hypothetical protein M8009_00750 [Halomonas sp. ATCH28]|uniref:DUF7210 domain-containing protein n=1 Tax=Halomonas gemina TaxID=2945105 RepID=A0ABT0SVZ3_9GAMM|nr:hypothetical protein [Halomonas gemina]MCL7938831.1 hypothetical protein [Halomonas gemina]
MSDTKAQPADLVQVTLKKSHTHSGQPHKVGDKLKVRPDQLERLKKHGKI